MTEPGECPATSGMPRFEPHAEEFGDTGIFQGGRDVDDAEPDLDPHLHDGVPRTHVRPGVETEECPYPGLSAFTAEQARWFFGRAATVADLVARLTERLTAGGPLFVLGSSGAGKSSLLRAGLLPALVDGAIPRAGSDRWLRVVMTPTARPVDALTTALATALGLDPDTVAEAAGDPTRLAGTVREALVTAVAEETDDDLPDPKIVIVVDQFDELFVLGATEHERRRFVALLAHLCSPVAGDEPAALVVYALRTDSYGRCAELPELRTALEDRPIIVEALTETGLREAVLAPAQATGLEVEAGLIELLLRDLRLAAGDDDGVDGDRADDERTGGHYEPGRLPLLAHALRATWRLRQNGLLTVQAYQATGGVHHAVAETAEAVFAGFDEVGRQAARRLLLSLVVLGDGDGGGTRRGQTRTDLLRDESTSGRASAVLDALIAGGLLSRQADDTVEIVHDALLSAWPRLRGWINEERAGLLMHRQVADAADTWKREGRSRGILLKTSRLAAMREWAENHDHAAALTAAQREFIAASVRVSRLRRLGAAGTALVLLIALIAAFSAVRQSQATVRQEAVVASRQLAVQARVLRDSDPAAALQLSLMAWRTAKTREAREELYTSYTTPYPITLDIQAGTGGAARINSVAFSADGRTLASGDAGRHVRLWDVTDPHRPAAAATLDVEGMPVVAFSPKGHLLATHAHGSLLLWDASAARRPRLLSRTATTTGAAFAVAFSPDGRTLATGGDQGIVRLWNITDPSHPAGSGTVSADAHDVTGVAFRADGRTLATAGDGGKVRLWDLARQGPKALAVLPVKKASGVAFDPIGRLLAAGGALGRLDCWDVSDPARPVRKRLGFRPTPDEPGDILSVAFSGDGQTLAAADTKGKVNREHFEPPIKGGVELEPRNLPGFPNGATVRAVAFHPDNRTVAAGGDDGHVRLWTTLSVLLPGVLSSQAKKGTPGSAFGDSGRTLVTSDPRLGVTLWDIRNRLRPVRAAILPPPAAQGAFMSDGHTLITSDDPSSGIRLWDARDPRRPIPQGAIRKPGPADGTMEYEASAESDLLVMTVRSGGPFDRPLPGVVHIWDISDRGHPAEVATVTDPVRVGGVGLNPEGRLLLTFGAKGAVRLWSLADPRHPGEPRSVPMSGDTAMAGFTDHGQLLLAKYDREVALFEGLELKTPVRKRVFDVHVNRIQMVDDDRFLVTASSDEHSIAFWDMNEARHPVSRVPLDVFPESLHVSEDGRALGLTGFDQGSHILVWDVSDPARVSSEPELTLLGTDMEFSPDNRTLAASVEAAGESGVQIWELSPDRLYAAICAADVGRPITRKQWSGYPGGLSYRRACV